MTQLSKALRDPDAVVARGRQTLERVRGAAEGARDARRLKRERPRLVPTTPTPPDMRERFDEYVGAVSSPDHAIAWQTVGVLWHLCHAVDARRVLDLGSGFSSYVMRRYAAQAGHDVTAVSIDDDAMWIERTKRFLTEQGLALDGVQLWDEFSASSEGEFDVIFHDIAGGDLRDDSAAGSAARLSRHGVIVFDDTHHPPHRRSGRDAARGQGLAFYSLYEWTHDSYGRWSSLAVG